MSSNFLQEKLFFDKKGIKLREKGGDDYKKIKKIQKEKKNFKENLIEKLFALLQIYEMDLL